MSTRGRKKLPELEARNERIRARRAQGEKMIAIAFEFGLDLATISRICRGRLPDVVPNTI